MTLPDYPIPEGHTIDTYFEHLSQEGLEERLAHLYPVEQRGDDWPEIRKPYDERLAYEVGIIPDYAIPWLLLNCHGLHSMV